MSSSKRRISDLLNTESSVSDRPSVKRRIDESTPLTLSYPSPSTPARNINATPFQKPLALLTFSYTPTRTLEFTNSAMRYFVEPPKGAKLGYAYDRWIRRPEEKGRVDGLLRAWSKVQENGQRMQVGVVAWRGVMTRVLTAPYEERDGWEVNVMYIDGTMYLEDHLSDAKLKEKNDMEPRHRLQSYYGYAFESYCTSSTPDGRSANANSGEDPDEVGWGGDVDTNVQWCSVVKTKLGDTRMVIGGEVDCVRDRYTGQTDNFVELKTSLAIRGPHDEAKFEKKLLKFYFQSFLLGVPEIVVGFRSPSGDLTTLQSFKTIHIPRLVRGKPGAWDPLVCLDWGQRFLAFLRDAVSESARDTNKGASDKVWRVKFVPGEGVRVVLLDEEEVEDVRGGEERVGFLPRWYWDEIQVKTETVSKPVVPRGWQI